MAIGVSGARPIDVRVAVLVSVTRLPNREHCWLESDRSKMSISVPFSNMHRNRTMRPRPSPSQMIQLRTRVHPSVRSRCPVESAVHGGRELSDAPLSEVRHDIA